MFTTGQIRDRVKKQPFRPLRIVTSSGESYAITHPDLIWIGSREVYVGMPSSKDPAAFDSLGQIAHISLLHITALEDLPPKVKKNGKNGKK
jgi:hypothetical protein